MLRMYDPVSDLLAYEEVSQWTRIPMRYLTGSILEELGCSGEEELESIRTRAFDICCLSGIPIHQHFRRVYIYKGGELQLDWQCSDFGLYLLLVNGKSQHPNVALAQLFFIRRLFSKK